MHETEKWKWSCSVVSDSLQPHGLQPTRLLHPWDFLGKSTGVGCHFLLWWVLNCGCRRQRLTDMMGRTGRETWSVIGVWPTTAGCENGARGPWIKKCKQLLEPESRPPLISSGKIVTSVLHFQGTEFFQQHELAEHRFSLEPPERDTLPHTLILAHRDPC